MKSKPSIILHKVRPYIFWNMVILLIFGIYRCKNIENDPSYTPITPIVTHFNGNGFAGSESCATCHIEIYKTHLKTAHFNTSAVADKNTVKGSFESPKNTFKVGSMFELNMVSTDSALYQKVNLIFKNEIISNSKIDIVVGSGVRGQSYLTWTDDKLWQLQASYNASTQNWINSPGYPDYVMNLRPITARCLECHTTYSKNNAVLKTENAYDKKQIIYGIDCERCHGPSAQHVGFHRSNPKFSEAKYMLRIQELSRQQRLDACALCHSGGRAQSIQIPFSFITGDKLSDFSVTDYEEVDKADLDVHGNQYGHLSSSKCFKETTTMDCSTCHDPHKNERGNTNSFNSKCINCHSKLSITCKENKNVTHANNNNCIACHMPLSPSKSMKLQVDEDNIPIQVRTHFIAVYTTPTTP